MIETYFHGVEVLILLFGVALPMLRSSQRLKNILQDFPPHRHVGEEDDKNIIYPRGFEPRR